MGQTLDNKALVIGVASSALFDLGESDQIFREEGVEAYERYQNEHLDEPFRPGVAFPFISTGPSTEVIRIGIAYASPFEELYGFIIGSTKKLSSSLLHDSA